MITRWSRPPPGLLAASAETVTSTAPDRVSDAPVRPAPPTLVLPPGTLPTEQGRLGHNRSNLMDVLFTAEGEVPAVSSEFLERWFSSGRTNALDLLAARQAGQNSEFLRQALTNFPNDPRVLLAAGQFQESPEAQRNRLDRLKAAAPENAIACTPLLLRVRRPPRGTGDGLRAAAEASEGAEAGGEQGIGSGLGDRYRQPASMLRGVESVLASPWIHDPGRLFSPLASWGASTLRLSSA